MATGGSGGAVDPSITTGAVISGSKVASGATLTDGAFTNVFAGFFTAGTQISFLLNLTTSIDAGATPDQFSFGILDPTGNPISTSDPSGLNNLFAINIDSTLMPQTFSSLVTVTQATTVPEPSSFLLLGTGLFGLVLATQGRRLQNRA